MRHRQQGVISNSEAQAAVSHIQHSQSAAATFILLRLQPKS